MGTAGICGPSVSLLTATPFFADETGGTGGTGEPVAELVKVCGYDAMTPGNHDWSYGKDRLKELGQISNVKMLAGNVETEDGTSFFDDDSLVKKYTKDGQTLKVGIFAVSDPEMKDKTTPSNVEGLVFKESTAYAQYKAEELKADGCDVSGVNYAQSDTFPQIANADEIGEYSACDEALISFFEQGEDAIGTSAAKKVMIQAT